MVCTGIMNRENQQQELEQLLQAYFQDLIIDLNLRMLADTDAAACICEPLLLVEAITVTAVAYPNIPQKESFRQNLGKKFKNFWKRITFR